MKSNGEDESEQHEASEFVEKALCEELETPLDQMLEEILSAYDFGFSLTEKVFKKNADGKLGLGALKTRHPATWLIHTDEQGHITKYEQRAAKATLDVNPDSLIHYINSPLFQNPYGKSDLRAAYLAWFTKRQIVKYYAIYLEKSASPIPVARYDMNAPAQAIDDIHTAIKSFQSKTALTIPKQIEIEFLEAKAVGDVYEKAINMLNMFIGRALFIPDLMGFQGSETGGGSYSLGTEQINVMFKHIQRRRQALEYVVNRHIVRPMVVYNFGFLDPTPRWCLNPIKDDDAIELAKLWLEAVKSKVFKASDDEINHFRAAAKFPEGDVEQVDQPAQIAVPGMPGAPNQQMPMQGDMQDAEQEDEKEPEKESEKEDEEKPAQEYAAKSYGDTPGDYSKKVNFAQLETSLNSFQDKTVAESGPIVSKMAKDLLAQIDKKGIVKSGKIEKLDSLKLKLKPALKAIVKEKLRDAYRDAQVIGQQEILRGNYATPIEDAEFIAFLEKEIDRWLVDLEARSIKTSAVRIIQAIKDGTPLAEIFDAMETDIVGDIDTSIERFARTKFTEVMNRGRRNFFENSGVVAAYQYSALMDDRTTDICSGLHGKIFASGNEPIPPLHWNCRSMLIPITKYEDFTESEMVGEQPIEDFINENIGDGFSWYSAKELKRDEELPASLEDSRVDFSRQWPSETTEVITYSFKGKPFREITIQYDANKKEIISKVTKELG